MPEFEVHVPGHRVKFLIIKPTRCTAFSNLFWNETLNVSDSSSVHHQDFSTVHTSTLCVIHVCWQLASRIRIEHPDPARKLSSNLYDVYHCCVHSGQLLMMDRGTVRNCRVSFQNTFQKLVHLVGFIIRKKETFKSPYIGYNVTDAAVLNFIIKKTAAYAWCWKCPKK